MATRPSSNVIGAEFLHPGVSYCGPYYTAPYDITTHLLTEQGLDWYQADNEADQEISTFKSMSVFGYTEDEFTDYFLKSSTSANSLVSIIDFNHQLTKNAVKCYFKACTDCKQECYIQSDYYYNFSNTGVFYSTPRLFYSSQDGDITVDEYIDVWSTVFVYVLLAIIIIKETLKICFLCAFFLSQKMQTSIVVKIFLNSPITWLFLICSKRLANEIKKIKGKRERMTLRRVLDICLEDIPSLYFTIWYTVTSRSLEFSALFALSGLLIVTMKNLIILMLNIKKDYTQTKKDSNSNATTLSQIMSKSDNNNMGNSAEASANVTISQHAFNEMHQKLQLVDKQLLDLNERVSLLEGKKPTGLQIQSSNDNEKPNYSRKISEVL